ncbi:MAG TPA: hypothetical protein VMQ17_08750 [Candidatus Sulfotelmatobacter sp.]|nr:hypothetical protein [Candidatus Sulfotelmatobacter sp.]
MSTESYAVLQVDKLEDNPVPIPRAARICKGPHKYDGTIVNNKAIGYVPVMYEYQEFPRMLYHPEWGARPKPEGARFFIGAITQEQMQNAMTAYQEAESKWARGNRVKLVGSPKEFDRLVKKGWLEKPPIRKENPMFDMESDEL